MLNDAKNGKQAAGGGITYKMIKSPIMATRQTLEYAMDHGGEGQDTFLDITSTELKRTLGETLDQAARGRRIRIARHGRTADRLVVMREADLIALEARAKSPLDALRAEFDVMVEQMQSPAARKAAASVGTASATELGDAAVKGFTAGG